MLKVFDEIDTKYRGKLLAILYSTNLLYLINNKVFFIWIMFAIAGPLFFLDTMSIIYSITHKDEEKEDSQ